ncbi:hypothetical protein, partial [Sulfitobacter sp. 15WGC]|uniref:hypothetical protein n=1 Tax=Sulfitobacter sp. 15WGC TaxID=2575437 RepID=UPI001B7FE44E
TTLLPMLHHLQTRSATFVYIGVVLLLFFSRIFGTGALWEAVMAPPMTRKSKPPSKRAQNCSPIC